MTCVHTPSDRIVRLVESYCNISHDGQTLVTGIAREHCLPNRMQFSTDISTQLLYHLIHLVPPELVEYSCLFNRGGGFRMADLLATQKNLSSNTRRIQTTCRLRSTINWLLHRFIERTFLTLSSTNASISRVTFQPPCPFTD